MEGRVARMVNNLKVVQVGIKLIQTIVKVHDKKSNKASKGVDIDKLMAHRGGSNERADISSKIESKPKSDYIKTWYDYNNNVHVKAYEIPFMKGPDFATLYIGLDYEYVKVICEHPRSHYGAGFDDSGGAYYDFPMIESLDYLNVAAFLHDKSWLGGNFGGSLVSREEYESMLSDIGYTE